MLKWLILQLAVSLDPQESGLRALKRGVHFEVRSAADFNDGERTLGESRHPHPSLVSGCPHGTQSSSWIPAQPTVAE
jgi:hypothetical protein